MRPDRTVSWSVQTDHRDSDSQRPFTLRKGFIPEPLQIRNAGCEAGTLSTLGQWVPSEGSKTWGGCQSCSGTTLGFHSSPEVFRDLSHHGTLESQSCLATWHFPWPCWPSLGAICPTFSQQA